MVSPAQGWGSLQRKGLHETRRDVRRETRRDVRRDVRHDVRLHRGEACLLRAVKCVERLESC